MPYLYVNFASVTAIGLIFPILGLLALATRIYGRVKYTKVIDIDDVLVIPAAILTVLAGVGMVIAAQIGFVGGHTPAQSFGEFLHVVEEQQIMLEKFEYAYWIGHVLAIGSIKLTFLFFFRRIFKGRGSRTAFDYINWAMILLVAVWMVAFVFLEIFMCGLNFSAAWSSVYALRTYCMDTFALLTSCAITSWVMDLAILAIPLAMISTLHMTLKRKVQASLVFALGLFTVIAGLLRMIVLIQVLENSLVDPKISLLGSTFETSDDEGVISLVLFWTYVEIGVGFLVVCLVACGRVFDEASTPVLAKIRRVSAVVVSRTSSRSSLFSSQSREDKEDDYNRRIRVSSIADVQSKEAEAGMPAVPEWLQASRRETLDV